MNYVQKLIALRTISLFLYGQRYAEHLPELINKYFDKRGAEND